MSQPQFQTSERVRVRQWEPPGHIRTPSFIRGHTGIVQQIAGQFRNPEELAYGRKDAPLLTLYRVTFAHDDLWPESPPGEQHAVIVDIYENWLEPAERKS